MRSVIGIFLVLLICSAGQAQFPYYAPGTNARGVWTQYAGAADFYYGPRVIVVEPSYRGYYRPLYPMRHYGRRYYHRGW